MPALSPGSDNVTAMRPFWSRHSAETSVFETVLADITNQKPDARYCLGDLVGYERDECGCAYREERDRQLGDQSLAWTKAHTTAANKAFLRSLLPQIRFEHNGKRVLLVHGSPRKINEYLFENRALSSFQRLAASSNADIIVFGHTHKPYLKPVDGVLFVNVGSVGKPKDGDWRACYAMLDLNNEPTVEFRRLEYDVKNVVDAIRASELPDEFALDIETGGTRQ
jgi:predicted phosphodiesterase